MGAKVYKGINTQLANKDINKPVFALINFIPMVFFNFWGNYV